MSWLMGVLISRVAFANDGAMATSRVRALLGGTVLVAVVAAVLWIVPAFRAEAVRTVGVEVRDIHRTLVVLGQVRSASRAGLGAAVSGVVAEVRVGEGDRVRAGETLVVLEDREQRAAVAQAEAALAEVVASVAADVEQAEREVADAEREAGRLRALYAEVGIALQRLEEAERRVADARTRRNALGTSPGAGSASATEARARATLEGARARLASTRVVAPADGTVLERQVEPGDAVQPGRVLLVVAADGPTEIVAFPAEENLSRIVPGAHARVSADAFPADTFRATVARIASAVDAAQGTIEVRLDVPEPPPYLRPDMTVSVNLEAGRRAGASVLPVEAVRGLGTDAPWVAVVREGRIDRRDVTLGIRGDTFVEVLSGVGAGESVVLGAETLGPGTRVRSRP
jgi:HlyD family secretion protein